MSERFYFPDKTGETKWVSVIGTRNLQNVETDSICKFIASLRLAAGKGFAGITGAAPGTDQLGAETLLEAGAYVHLVVPWASYERDWIDRMDRKFPGQVSLTIYEPSRFPEWDTYVDRIHPNPAGLTYAQRKPLARNVGIIEPSATVMALPDKRPWSGTRFGMKYAKLRKRKVYDFTQRNCLTNLK